MQKNNLNDILLQAQKENWAVGHFNISNLEQLRAMQSQIGHSAKIIFEKHNNLIKKMQKSV